MQELKKQNEDLKQRVHSEGTNTSQSRRNRKDNGNKAHSPRNSKRETSKHTAQLTHGNDQVLKNIEEGVRRSQEFLEGKDNDKS